MHPRIAGLDSYGLFMVLAIGAGVLAGLPGVIRSGISAARFGVFLVITIVFGLGFAKLYFIIEQGGALTLANLEIAAGYRYPGAVIGILMAMATFGSRLAPDISFADLVDEAAPALGTAMVVQRIGCFLNGCCFGTVSTVPWAVQFPSSSLAWVFHIHNGLLPPDALASLPVHPLELYLGLASLAGTIFSLWYGSRKTYPGQVMLLYLAIDNGGKAIFESLRFSYVRSLQLASLGLSVGAILILIFKAIGVRAERLAPDEKLIIS